MRRLSPLLFVIVLSTQLLAQSRNDGLDAAATNLISNVTTYCNSVEHHSNSVPRIFARITSADYSSGWIAYDSEAAWNRAGRPQPVALVWYSDAKIVRVAITPNDDGQRPEVYADYCYRQDGTLARLRSVPSVQHKCEPNRNQCTLVRREVRFYPPEGPVLKTYGLDRLPNLTGTTGVIIDPLPAERIVETFVPMKWPEYLHVTDLPFSELLYATLR